MQLPFRLQIAITVLSLLFCAHGVNIVQSIDDLSLDEEDRLSSHVLLYNGGVKCDKSLSRISLAERKIIKASPELMELYIKGQPGPNECQLVCIERGMHYSHLKHPLDHQMTTISTDNDILAWLDRSCQAAELGLISYLDNDASVFWVDFTGNYVPGGILSPGERNTFWTETYLGHKFAVVDNRTNQTITEITVQYNAIIPIGEYFPRHFDRDVRQLVRGTFDAEWKRAHRVTRTFTEFGFNKGKLPIDLYSSMSAYYYNNQHHATVEEWENKGVFVNWWEQHVYFIAMPFRLKKYWQSRLKELVEAWVGVPLELTDIYGMRRYEEGARLLTHVDREATHACSLIVNVAQSGMRRPWPVEIYDFGDRLHEIEMEEGDIVYYESARCLHGRMQPLHGAQYVNLFAHYRPINDPEWFLKPNPPDATEPVMKLGLCKSNGTKAICDETPYEVPYLSPTLEKLSGPQDLYNFWERVGRADYIPTSVKLNQGQQAQASATSAMQPGNEEL